MCDGPAGIDSCAGTCRCACGGDCNGDAVVEVGELTTLVDIALEHDDLASCEAGDLDGDGTLRVEEIVSAVGNAEGECAAP